MKDWNAHYRNAQGLEFTPTPVLARAVKGLPLGDALDLACGHGRNAIWLAGQGWRVTAVDAASAAIDILRQRAPSVNGRVADLERGEFQIEPGVWDLICDIHYVQPDLFPAIRSGLRPGGLFVAQLHTGNPRYPLSSGQLRTAFSGFETLHWAEIPGERPFVELIARKPLSALP